MVQLPTGENQNDHLNNRWIETWSCIVKGHSVKEKIFNVCNKINFYDLKKKKNVLTIRSVVNDSK